MRPNNDRTDTLRPCEATTISDLLLEYENRVFVEDDPDGAASLMGRVHETLQDPAQLALLLAIYVSRIRAGAIHIVPEYFLGEVLSFEEVTWLGDESGRLRAAVLVEADFEPDAAESDEIIDAVLQRMEEAPEGGLGFVFHMDDVGRCATSLVRAGC